MTSELTSFKIADLLDSEAAIQEYLSQVLAEGDADEIMRAQSHVQAARLRNTGG
ncbi:transcriptional regulator [Pseudomonas sp. B21-023]|uniref:helix-turn-helix domain-containing transcriptional regulator n=1 Tax=unclassified Pseudomonas TaxID=196821 RepID=UPI001118BE25|nr:MULTISPECIES: transcriptional regulator [unclassified Pseudomonas]UVL20188.1 transcriptional regulator [Pseudomonas sp. B21-044]UVM17605.1 transcriptional regulator [Pseudomonas sp. B21-023]